MLLMYVDTRFDNAIDNSVDIAACVVALCDLALRVVTAFVASCPVSLRPATVWK